MNYGTWKAGATVVIGDPNDPNNVYGGNTPEARVFAVSYCRGDAWNSGMLDFDDVDPFIELLYDFEDYCAHYPGLRGSAFFKGNVSGDDVIDFDDIAFFVERLQSEDPTCNCSPDPGYCSEDDSMGAAQLAAALQAHVPAERHSLLADIAWNLGNYLDDYQRRAYWWAVWEYLTN